VCDLKCETCGLVTTHAKVSEVGHDSTYERIALGANPTDEVGYPWSTAERRRLQQQYRLGLPRNPNLIHLWWMSEVENARAAGASTIVALCGEPIPLPRTSGPSVQRLSTDAQLEPRPVRVDEYEDLDTGLSWRDGDCVDCLRVHNESCRERNRRELLRWLTRAGAQVDSLDADTVDNLVRCLRQAFDPRRPEL
jgi:hypothetical protein